MHLAEGRGVVAIQFEDLSNRRGLVWPDGVVSGRAGRDFGDRAHPDRMMVVAGQQGLARRRAEGGRVKLRVAQAVLRERIEGWHIDAAAERARSAEADI